MTAFLSPSSIKFDRRVSYVRQSMIDTGHPYPHEPEHSCPQCGKRCVFNPDSTGHRCIHCRSTHETPMTREAVTLRLIEAYGDPAIAGPRPVWNTEMEACLVVAEVHALRALGYRYAGYHKGTQGDIHLEVMCGPRILAELFVPYEESFLKVRDYFEHERRAA